MSDTPELLLKFLMKSGQPIALYASEAVINELIAHPKFLAMRDEGNDVFVSIEDIAAFEIMSNRREPPKVENEPIQPQDPVS